MQENQRRDPDPFLGGEEFINPKVKTNKKTLVATRQGKRRQDKVKNKKITRQKDNEL